MIRYIKGNIVNVYKEFIIVENNGLGYKVFTSKTTMGDYFDIDVNEKIMIHTEMVVREDDISVFGFSTEKELKVFNLLRSVSRVGAKSATKILSTMHYLDLIKIIKAEDYKSLTKAKGVGTKTAKRIIIDLREKMEKQFPGIVESNDVKNIDNKISSDALEALIALGYSKKEANGALVEFDNTGLTIEEIIKKALMYF